MTKKDYVLLAGALAEVRNSYAPHWDPNLFRACDDHLVAIAGRLEQENPKFNRATFLKAAGYGTK